ncbi:MAG: TRAP transporter small permease [Desulfobacteraceae bacterium]|nr:TRAP transporter small permease [Desulfobacteraceae bacterium]
MNAFEKSTNGLARGMYYVAGAAIVSMMLLTCADVLLRFGVTLYHSYRWQFLENIKPIPGTYELVCFMGAVAVSFAMAHTSVEKGHVAVSLIVRLFPERVRATIESITSLLSFFLFAMISWQSVAYANDLRETGEVSLTLELPFYPFVYGVAFSAAAVCLVIAVAFSKNIARAVVR